MPGTRDCSCTKCEKSCHVVLKTDRAQSIGRLKLMEQAHCAYCWEPLKANTEWPCTRSAWRIGTKFKDLSVNHCGHVFHTLCINKQTHCRQCHVLIRGVSPLHVILAKEESKEDKCQSPSSMDRRINQIEKELEELRLK